MSLEEASKVHSSEAALTGEAEPHWIRQQRKTFTAWCNHWLKERNIKLERLEQDLSSGVALCNLLELLAREELPGPKSHPNPRSKMHKLENLNLSFSFMEQKRIPLVNIGPEDIYDGRTKLALGLIWTLILRFQIQQGESESGSVKSQLLDWCKSVLSSMDVELPTNFQQCWSDGTNFCALVNVLSPNAINLTKLDKSHARENMELAFTKAEDLCQIPRLLDVDDMLEGRPDELSVITYVSYFRREHQAAAVTEAASPAEAPAEIILKSNNSSESLLSEEAQDEVVEQEATPPEAENGGKEEIEHCSESSDMIETAHQEEDINEPAPNEGEKVEEIEEEKNDQTLYDAAESVSIALPLSPRVGGESVQLFLDSKDLSKGGPTSNTVAVISIKQGDKWEELGRTQLSSKATPVIAIYHFQKVQQLRVHVHSIQDKQGSIDDKNLIGQAECRLSELMTASGQSLTLSLKDNSGQTKGDLVMQGKSLKKEDSQPKELNIKQKYIMNKNPYYQFVFSARDLDKKKPDPLFVIMHYDKDAVGDKKWVPVYTSETAKGTTTPIWNQFELSAAQLNKGDVNRPLRIQIWESKISGSRKLIGEVKTDTNELCCRDEEFPIINKKKEKKKKYIHSGLLKVGRQSELREERTLNPYYGYNTHSFLEYVAGGCQISLIIAIVRFTIPSDFTASNGNPKDPKSLHYMDPTGVAQNEYVSAIKSVGKILSDYDRKKKYPVYGFGTKKKSEGKAGQPHHCFPLNGKEKDPRVKGIDGVLKVYEKTFDNWILSGPTNFAEIIGKAAAMARKSTTSKRQHYYVLLMLTDGIISDGRETVREIVGGSSLPLSIVIVGVGEADFTSMEVLNAEDKPLVYNGQEMERNIVQFVPFRDFRSDPQQLAEKTLQKIPWQLTSYMALAGVAPKNRKK